MFFREAEFSHNGCFRPKFSYGFLFSVLFSFFASEFYELSMSNTHVIHWSFCFDHAR